jgi:hypothetical protein
MSRSILKKLVRNFPENGPKLLLENPANVRDLLMLLHEPSVDAIDFAAMTVERTHFVQPDYRHVAVDLLLKAPFRGETATESIFIYLLVEHQSTPLRFLQLRLAEYLIEAYKMQKQAWDRQHGSDTSFYLYPVIPVVLYTGERSWDHVEPLSQLVLQGSRFHAMIPSFTAHFLNLRDTPAATLANDGGFFGQILWLIQQRHADVPMFQETLEQAVTTLEGMPEEERTRWVEFLSYTHALVYHAREEVEQQPLRDVIDRSVQTNSHRQEYRKMGRTIAEMYIDRGRLEGERKGEQKGALLTARDFLLRSLRKRFKDVPVKLEEHIAHVTDLQQLATWHEKVYDAKTLEEVGIPID